MVSVFRLSLPTPDTNARSHPEHTAPQRLLIKLIPTTYTSATQAQRSRCCSRCAKQNTPPQHVIRIEDRFVGADESPRLLRVVVILRLGLVVRRMDVIGSGLAALPLAGRSWRAVVVVRCGCDGLFILFSFGLDQRLGILEVAVDTLDSSVDTVFLLWEGR